jgi:hypothetical protein
MIIMGSWKELPDKNGNTRYHAQVRIKGHKPEYFSSPSLTKIKRWIQDTESAIRDGRYFKTTESKKHTLGELIDRYIRDVLPTKKKSEQKQSMQLNWWKKQIGFHLLSEITPALIAEQRDKLLREITKRKQPRNPSTVVTHLTQNAWHFD